MSMSKDHGLPGFNPLQDVPPQDSKLVSSPLEMVVTQLRFAPVPKMDEQAFIANFQDRLRKNYPLFAMEHPNLQLALPGMNGGEVTAFSVFWRMLSIESKWRVSLTRDFLALETVAYGGREDFLLRWTEILEAFNASFENITATRFGLRYLNRIKGEELQRLPTLVQREALGIVTSLGTPDVAITDVLYPVPEGKIHARWGHLPAGTTHDPSFLACAEANWILDMDLSIERVPLDMAEIGDLAKRFSERAYGFFHWMMTDQFRTERGA